MPFIVKKTCALMEREETRLFINESCFFSDTKFRNHQRRLNSDTKCIFSNKKLA